MPWQALANLAEVAHAASRKLAEGMAFVLIIEKRIPAVLPISPRAFMTETL